jgi:hypothetical protein
MHLYSFVIELGRDAILFCNIFCSYLQIPNDFSKMFDKDLFKLDTAVVPEVLRYEYAGVRPMYLFEMLYSMSVSVHISF